MNEVLAGMKVLKLYAWEPSIQEMIAEVRAKEAGQLKKQNNVLALSTILYIGSSFFVSQNAAITGFQACICTFASFTLIQGQELTPSIAFVTLMLFSIIRWSANEIPNTITSLASAKVSLNRIADFLYADELEECRDNSLMGNDESGKKKPRSTRLLVNL